jgi:hypothetical protein
VTIKKLLGWAAVALIVWWIITDPTAAAAFVHKLGGFITEGAHGFATFFANL